MNLALFDLDHTLLPLDSDYEWGQFLARIGAVDPIAFAARNAEFYAQYQAGTLNPVAYLEFAFGTLARFPRRQLETKQTQNKKQKKQPTKQPPTHKKNKRHQ